MRSATLWQISLALFVLFLIMEYAPGGVEIGMLILVGTVLATPEAATGFASALNWVENGGS